jgi:hypothetical protein
MGLSGNFNLQNVQALFGPVELNSTALNVKGLSQFHAYIFTDWDSNFDPKTLRDFTGLGRPELQDSITPSAPSWNSIKVDFNITKVNNQATLATLGDTITVGSMYTEVAVDYYEGTGPVELDPEQPQLSPFSTYEEDEEYTSTGPKSLTFTPSPANQNTTYQLRLRYYNRFNKESTPNAPDNGFDQSVVPSDGTLVSVTTPSFPQLPPPFSIFYRIENQNSEPVNEGTRVRIVWIYQNVTDAGSFTDTPNVGTQPATYDAQTDTLLGDDFLPNTDDFLPNTYSPATLVLNSTVNWGSRTNFNKGAVWNAAAFLQPEVALPSVQIRANQISTFSNSNFAEAELYQYPTVITNNSTLLSTTSFRVSMTLGNISGYNVVYFWQFREGTSGAFTDTQTFTVLTGGTYTFDITGLSSNTNYQFRAGVRRETDIFVNTFSIPTSFFFGDLKTQSTDIRPSSIIQGLIGGFGDVTLTVTWSHPPAYSNGLPTGGTYTVQILDLALQLVTQVTGISGTTTSQNFTNICSLFSDDDFIISKVIANIPNNIGTGERLADDFIEVSGCATENGGGNGGIGGPL